MCSHPKKITNRPSIHSLRPLEELIFNMLIFVHVGENWIEEAPPRIYAVREFIAQRPLTLHLFKSAHNEKFLSPRRQTTTVITIKRKLWTNLSSNDRYIVKKNVWYKCHCKLKIQTLPGNFTTITHTFIIFPHCPMESTGSPWVLLSIHQSFRPVRNRLNAFE